MGERFSILLFMLGPFYLQILAIHTVLTRRTADQPNKKKQNKNSTKSSSQNNNNGTIKANGSMQQQPTATKPNTSNHKNSPTDGTKSANSKKKKTQNANQLPSGLGGGHEPKTNDLNSGGNTAAALISSKPANKVNKTSELLETIPTTVVNNNLDDVLKTVRQLDNTCDFTRCRTKTSLIGQVSAKINQLQWHMCIQLSFISVHYLWQDCTLCHQRFCMKHQLPEVHGCGGAAKKTERAEFLRPRQTLPISAALRRNEQKDAHSRLEQKLKEMSLARQKSHKWICNLKWHESRTQYHYFESIIQFIL